MTDDRPGPGLQFCTVVVRGAICEGARAHVVRCIEIHYATTNRRYRAHASIFDNGNYATDYNVDVIAVGARQETEGGRPVAATGMGFLYNCPSGAATYSVVATYRWRQIGTSDTTTGTTGTSAVVCN